MPVSKGDVLQVKLSAAEVQYCVQVASRRATTKVLGAKAKDLTPEQQDAAIAQELSVYAATRTLFGFTQDCWSTWLFRRVVTAPPLDVPPSNIRVHGKKLEKGKKLSDVSAQVAGCPAGILHIVAVADFALERDTATVYLLGWARQPAPASGTNVLTASLLNPLPPVDWAWATGQARRLDDHTSRKEASCPREIIPPPAD